MHSGTFFVFPHGQQSDFNIAPFQRVNLLVQIHVIPAYLYGIFPILSVNLCKNAVKVKASLAADPQLQWNQDASRLAHFLHRFHFAHDITGLADKHPAEVRQCHAAPVADKYLAAYILLQLLDGKRQLRL